MTQWMPQLLDGTGVRLFTIIYCTTSFVGINKILKYINNYY